MFMVKIFKTLSSLFSEKYTEYYHYSKSLFYAIEHQKFLLRSNSVPMKGPSAVPLSTYFLQPLIIAIILLTSASSRLSKPSSS